MNRLFYIVLGGIVAVIISGCNQKKYTPLSISMLTLQLMHRELVNLIG